MGKNGPKAGRLYGWRYKVVGKGAFPIDMMRYDHSYPDSEEDANRIERHANPLLGSHYERWAVTLVRWSPCESGPTDGRWQSHGWLVVEMERIKP